MLYNQQPTSLLGQEGHLTPHSTFSPVQHLHDTLGCFNAGPPHLELLGQLQWVPSLLHIHTQSLCG